MPTGCRTCEKQVPLQYTGGEVVVLPWCVEHCRWYAECQGLSVAGEPQRDPTLPDGVADFGHERAKRLQKGWIGQC